MICVWEGTDPLSGNQVQYKYSYIGEEVRLGHKLVDIVEYDREGFLQVDVAHFHSTVALDSDEPFIVQSLDVERIARV